MKVLKVIALLLFCIGLPVALWVGVRIALTLSPTSGGPSNGELITTLLTGLTISIAVLAVVIGLVAIWGYHAIKDDAKDIAAQQAKIAVDKYLEGPEVGAKTREWAQKLIAEEVAKAQEGMQLSYSQPLDKSDIISETEETKKVGQPYPEERRTDEKRDPTL